MNVQEAIAALEAAARKLDKTKTKSFWGDWYFTVDEWIPLIIALAALDLARAAEAERCPECKRCEALTGHYWYCDDCGGTGKRKEMNDVQG